MASPAIAKRRRCDAARDVEHVDTRLARLLHQGCISQQGLLNILRELKATQGDIWDSCPVGVKRLRKVEGKEFSMLRVSEEITLVDGERFIWEFADPGLLLSRLVNESAALQDLFGSVMPAGASEVAWNCVVAFDEFAPGNKLKVNNRRKMMVLSFSFLELGQIALTRSVSWITPVCLRHSVIESTPGGWSNLFRIFLHRLLLGPCGLIASGVALQIRDRNVLLRARLSNVLSDGDGLKIAFDWRGGSSLKPCFLCTNVFKKNSGLAHRRAGYVEITCATPDSFHARDLRELNANIDMLMQSQRQCNVGTVTKTQHHQLEIMLGLNTNPLGFLADSELRKHVNPRSAFTYDWVHNSLQDGTLTAEIWQLLHACRPLGVMPSHLHDFLKDEGWEWPAHMSSKGKQLHRIFDSYRSKSSIEADRLKASASECLGAYALIRHFVETRIGDSPDIIKQKNSFLAACAVLDLILLTKQQNLANPRTTSRELRKALALHFELHLQAYGEGEIKPKHHWNLHVPDQLHRDGVILDAFIIERKHLSVKRLADHIDNTSAFERSVLNGVIHDQVQTARRLAAFDGLQGKIRTLGTITLANHLEFNTLRVSAGDIIFHGEEAGQALSCAMESNVLMVIVQLLQRVGNISSHSARYAATCHQAVWLASEVSQSAAWYKSGETVVALSM